MTTPPSSSNRPSGNQPGGNRGSSNRPVGSRPTGKGPNPPGRPAAGPPPANRPVGSRPTGSTPNRGGRTVGAGPALRDPRGGNANRTILLALVGLVAVVLIAVVGLNLFGDSKPKPSPIGAGGGATPAATGSTGSPAAPTQVAGAAAGPANCPTAPPDAWKADDSATVTFKTDKGDIVIAVKGSLAPHATANFVALASCGFYDGVVFHRLVPGFVIQGGDGQFGREPNLNPSRVGTGGPGYTIADDKVTATYKRGVLAMARTSEPNSQGSQFFIVLSDEAAQALASYNTYAIMGEVTQGMDVVDAIAAMPNAGGQSNAAVDPLPILKATVTRP